MSCPLTDGACGVPTNARIRLRFDRALLPSTAVRQAIRVYTGTPSNAAPPTVPHYDILSSELTFTFQNDLRPGLLYQVEFTREGEAGDSLLRAFDGAPLPRDELTQRWSFLTARRRDPALDQPPPSSATCAEVLPALAESCASGCCHAGSTPAMGLSLESRDGLLAAVNRVAHQTETGDGLGVSFEDAARFGVGMPLIDPNRAHGSYLVYKLLLEPQNLSPCPEGRPCSAFLSLPGAADCRPLPEDERRRLAEWFVLGAAMPLAWDCQGRRAHRTLDCATLRALTTWIDSGARCD